MAGPYFSTERVYSLDSSGDPYSLLYAVGDEIPEEEARRQGLTEDAASKPEGKARVAANKARRPAAVKTTEPEPEET